MFRMMRITDPTWAPHGGGEAATDLERNARLRGPLRGGRHTPGCAAFALYWNEAVIPFEIYQYRVPDDPGQEPVFARFLSFGVVACGREGVASYRFESEEERQTAQMLAVEALLTFGEWFYNYNTGVGQNFHIEMDGKTYTKSMYLPHSKELDYDQSIPEEGIKKGFSFKKIKHQLMFGTRCEYEDTCDRRKDLPLLSRMQEYEKLLFLLDKKSKFLARDDTASHEQEALDASIEAAARDCMTETLHWPNKTRSLTPDEYWDMMERCKDEPPPRPSLLARLWNGL